MIGGGASKMDTVRFRKVLALMSGGATEGERAAARARASAMAERAGMTLAQAIMLHAKPETPAERHAREVAEKWDQARRARQAEAERRYGPKEHIFAESEEEKLLSAAVEPFKERSSDPAFSPFVKALSGWCSSRPLADLPPLVADAIRSAIPFPSTVRKAYEEAARWHALLSPRFAFDTDYEPELWVSAREDFVNDLFWSLGASNLDDIAAREAWVLHRIETSVWWPDDAIRLAGRMRMDAEWVVHLVLMSMMDRAPSAAPRHRTTAERRGDVLSILDSNPELSDREIARRVGVSPQTVNTWRKRHPAERDSRADRYSPATAPASAR